MNFETLNTSELRQGMTVNCHGLLCKIDRPIESKLMNNGFGLRETYWSYALVLNRDEVSDDRVPIAWTQPRLRNGYPDEDAIARGEHRWSIQGNDLAQWSVLVDLAYLEATA